MDQNDLVATVTFGHVTVGTYGIKLLIRTTCIISVHGGRSPERSQWVCLTHVWRSPNSLADELARLGFGNRRKPADRAGIARSVVSLRG